MKKKCNEQEFLLRKDERVSSLEKQLEWFRQEALQLSKASHEIRSENKGLKKKCENLDEEKSFLEE